jgi:hypothetical protein
MDDTVRQEFSTKQNLARHSERILLRRFGNFGGIFGGIILEGEGRGGGRRSKNLKTALGENGGLFCTPLKI